VFSDMSVEENLEMGACSARAQKRLAAQLAEVYVMFPRLKERRAQKA